VTATPPNTSTRPEPPLYHEEQRFGQWWIWILVVVPAGLAWWPFIAQIIGGEPVGQNPAPDWLVLVIWLFIGIGLPVLFGLAALVIEVRPGLVLVRFRPFSRRSIAIGDVERVEARTYSAMKEYGGWGIKGWSKQNVAYNVSGNRGAELTLRDGRRIMLGSRRAEELAEVIEAQARAQRSRPPADIAPA
jgi:hypothetical protein